jgi:hypothetical protein
MLTTNMKSCGLHHPSSPYTERDIGTASDKARRIQNLLFNHRRLLIYFTLVRCDLLDKHIGVLTGFPGTPT